LYFLLICILIYLKICGNIDELKLVISWKLGMIHAFNP
jgi:hypothetical protein